MKNKVLASVVLGAGITFGGIFGHSADASEVNNQDLIVMAKENSVVLNEGPIKEGNYNISFTDGQYEYHFWNVDGTFGWKYELTGHSGQFKGLENSLDGQSPTQVHTERLNEPQNTQKQEEQHKQKETPESKVDKQQKQFDYQNKVDKQETQKQTPKVKQESTSKSSGGSTKERFLDAGGTEAMWNSIVMPESTGDPNASNGQYSGLFQMSPQSGNGTGSVEEQTKSAIKYANDRYGSVDNAISERESKGWW